MQENPNNIFLVVILTLAILFGYDYFFVRPKLEEAQQQVAAEQAARRAAIGDLETQADPTLTPETSTAPVTPKPATTVDEATIDAGYVAIETPALSGRLSLRGARFESLRLNNHTVSLDSEEQVELLSPYGSERAYYARFGWAAEGAAGTLPGERTAWQADKDVLRPGEPVTLSWTNEAGTTFKQIVSVDEQFLFTVESQVENGGDAAIRIAPYGLISRRGTPTTDGLYILHEGPFGVIDETFQEYSYEDFEEEPKVEAASTGGWMGLTDKYWMTVLIPDQSTELSRASLTRRGSVQDPVYQASFVENWHSVAPGAMQSSQSYFYAGAKEVGVIDAYGDTLGIALFDRAIDWGWFYFLTRPIFFLLDLFNGLTGNFGVAIILLVIVLKLALFPLANRQYESMARMKEAQPKIKAMQERFKDDRARLQQEMMKFYKKEKINPLAGCLPLLPQVFIFFALYKVLYVTIDMRHAPFFGWIKDLSAPDPLTPVNLFGLVPWDPPSVIAIGVWPILMGLTMWLQQKLHPSAMDPTQQKVMALLPIIFTFILANFSAGLVIYWTLNSALSVLQQWVITRRVEAKKAT